MDRPTDPKERFFIAPEPGETTSLKDSFLVAIRYRSVVYKIFKLVFRSRTADLYFTFPYLSGFATFQQWRSLRPGEIGDQITPVPSEAWRLRAPKLSYHESGVVHFKSLADGDEMTHVRTVCTPIRLLAGEHILTVQVEGYETFKIAKPRETANSSTWIIDIPDWAENTKITVFAGFSAEAVGRHYRTPEGVRIPHKLLTFVRPTLPRPLSIAMYNSSSLSLQQPEIRQPFIIAMGGFLNDRSQRRTALIARVAPKPA